MAKAVARLCRDIDKPLRIEQIAQEFGMSVSGSHNRFKVVTAMGPLQYQKRLRLQEARPLMLPEYLDAASAALQVGCRDASHLYRECQSLLGGSLISKATQTGRSNVSTAG